MGPNSRHLDLMSRVLSPIIVGILLLAVGGCGARSIAFESQPPGAALEMTVVDETTTTGYGTTAGSYQYDPNSVTGMSYRPGSVQTQTTTARSKSRRVYAYTPATISWTDTDDPDDYVVARKGEDWVVFAVIPTSAQVFIDFEKRPMEIRGARLLDASREAVQR